MRTKLSAATAAVLLGSGVVAAPVATAAPPAEEETVQTVTSDNLPNPLDAKRTALREAAITGVLEGDLTAEERGDSTVVKVSSDADISAADGPSLRGSKGRTTDQYVELSRETTDRIFVVLAEFGDEESPYGYADDAQRTEGPLHNEIPEPDRSVNNTTVWQADYSQSYFQGLYFGDDESLREYYETQSSGRYSVDGEVTDWVKVPYTQAAYGTDACGSIVCSTVWDLVADAATIWYEDQLAQGRSVEDVNADLASFDVWDRYDYDGDGDFNEPDGYIDHFQIVHAGGDQADGDPIYGSDAIWSHRWYAYYNYAGLTGPEANPLGGTQIGDSGIWIGDYTMQPENGGRSVFYHEYGHDLGLPDDYNVQSGGDNNNEYWTLMAQSRLTAADDEGIGERGGDLGAWNKLQLGWLDYEYVEAGDRETVTLGVSEYNTRRPQALIVGLPEKTVTTDLGEPAVGAAQWYSGTGDDLTSTLTRSVDVPDGSPALTFQTRYDIEEGYDYLYVEVDDGSGFVPIAGSITTVDEPAATDGTQADWIPATFDLSAYAGQTVDLRIRYTTDGGVAGNDPDVIDGVFLDEIAVEGVFEDGAEDGDGGWTVDGFTAVGTSSTQSYPNYYIAAYRSYTSYDQYLKTGPYHFGYASTLPDYVDHYSYQEGLLISYWDLSYSDNDTFAHPGSGRNLYIDSHPQPMTDVNGDYWRARVQVYDAPFSLKRADSFTLHVDGVKSRIKGARGNRVFDDTDQYWFAELPNHGVKLPAVGVQIRIVKQKDSSMTVKVY
ncbi:immune inhibitor A domain-containing protein [Demequina sp. NBRC 110054]|uniref:immune inhibitor A domain-containing protein n=1 Tax=Demequina sp. NBRC 110054 TaxID=1570343 RepID=UPI00190E9C5D|nr:immune inhibitor A domain-containing protein [Demequina sp. NBRC 110054]